MRRRSMNTTRITNVRITPVAFRDPALLNAVGVHQPFALRSIIELDTSDGVVGLGESYGDFGHLERLHTAASAIIGLDIFSTNQSSSEWPQRSVAWSGATPTAHGAITPLGTVLRVFSGFEVACLDAQGKVLNRPVGDLLGGALRSSVPFSAYLFYKWASHPGEQPIISVKRWTPTASSLKRAGCCATMAFKPSSSKVVSSNQKKKSTQLRRCATDFPTRPCGLIPTPRGPSRHQFASVTRSTASWST